MQLTTQTTETLVRRFAAASKPELDKCAKELKSMATDFGQSSEVRIVAKDFAGIVRKHLRRFA